MLAAEKEVRPNESLVALHAIERDSGCPDFPKDFFPTEALVAHKSDKVLHLKVTVCHVLSDSLSVEVDEDLSSLADLPFPLLLRKELFAVDAHVELTFMSCRLFGNHLLEFLHVKLTHQLVLPVSQIGQLLKRDLLGDCGQELRTQAVHINGQSNHIAEVLLDKVNAHVHQVLHA
jgi:hypothetical protein